MREVIPATGPQLFGENKNCYAEAVPDGEKSKDMTCLSRQGPEKKRERNGLGRRLRALGR